MRHFNTFGGIYLAADAAVRRRRARDAEPTNGELDNEVATPEDLLAIVREWLTDMHPEDAEKLFDGLLELKSNHELEQGVDRAHRGFHGARRAHALATSSTALTAQPARRTPATRRFPAAFGRRTSASPASPASRRWVDRDAYRPFDC
jgi:hypothetical protein